MQYLSYIFENEDVIGLAERNEIDINAIVRESISPFILTNFNYIIENMDKFIDNDNLVDSFERIKSFVRDDMVNMISAIAEVSSLDEDFDHVDVILQENVSSVFTGAGYGTQKSQRLISSTYS